MGEKGNEFQLGHLGRWFLQVKQLRRVQEVEPLLKQILSQELRSDPQGRGELGRSQGDLRDSKGFREQGCCWLEAGIRAGKWESPAGRSSAAGMSLPLRTQWKACHVAGFLFCGCPWWGARAASPSEELWELGGTCPGLPSALSWKKKRELVCGICP